MADDSYLLDFSSDANCTSLDLTGVTQLPSELPWMSGNRVAYLPTGSNMEASNVVIDGQCATLALTPDGGDFRPAVPFTAKQATLTLQLDGCRTAILPFAADIPEGVKVYAVDAQLSLEPLEAVPAHTPVLVEARGEVVFTGSGEVAYRPSPLTDMLRGAYARVPLYKGDYVLASQDGQWGFLRLDEDGVLEPFGVYASLDTTEPFVVLKGGELIVEGPVVDPQEPTVVYDLSGRRVGGNQLSPGIYIVNGKKMAVKDCLKR